MGCIRSSEMVIRPNEMRLITVSLLGVLFGFLIGSSFPIVNFNLPSSILPSNGVSVIENEDSGHATEISLDHSWTSRSPQKRSHQVNDTSQIYVPSNPRGAELLAPGIVVPQSDLYLRRLWGDPSQDLQIKPKYLVTFTVGYKQKTNIDAAVKKFSENFTILLFHYDGQTSGWDEFEWSKRAIHVSVQKQSKWWYAKRFMHPDIVAAYDYIFLWDEDLGLEHFDAERYIKVIRKHKLEISQPGLDQKSRTLWRMPRRREEGEMHKETTERPGWCSDPHLPPCAAFVDLTAPVFSRDAWRCVWYMIQNDLVHGWGLDFIGLRRCVQPAHERIGVVDSHWVVRQSTLSLADQGQAENGTAGQKEILERSQTELVIFMHRMTNADKAYFEAMVSTQAHNSTRNY
ncbi:uncharacterized protein LOC116250887 [Nymphaea colorata]|nr:uncharacterized protein LOC116250887 [Nymphaea colorata]XP_049932503.1 uncharacterized protein LOC116250887 [Nymphaea colorata]